MSDQPTELTTEQAELVRAACKHALNSTAFSQAERLRSFLSYVVENTLAGQGARISQYALAEDVFGRDETFDPAVDAIIRVEAGRLRSKLRDYYAQEGVDQPVIIELVRGGYSAGFTFRGTHTQSEPLPNLSQPTPVNPKPTAIPVTKAKPILAVLPFVSMSGAEEDEYLADGFTEDLITDISKTPGLAVIARQSTFAYKGARLGVREICQELGANFAMEGSIRRFANKLRINAQLIDGLSNVHLWAERFDCDVEDIFEAQERVNTHIVETLKLKLICASQTPAPNIQAHDYVLIGLKEARAITKDGSAKARYCYERAIEIDPQYAAAHARLAVNLLWQWIVGWCDDYAQSVAPALTLARKSVELDASAALGHSALCWCLAWSNDHEDSIKAGEKAIALNPNDVDALERLSQALSLSRRPTEALEVLSKAKTLNPHEKYAYATGVAHFMAGDYEAANHILHQDYVARPRFLPSLVFLAASYGLSNHKDKAQPIVTRIQDISPAYKHNTERLIYFKHQEDRDRFTKALDNIGLA